MLVCRHACMVPYHHAFLTSIRHAGLKGYLCPAPLQPIVPSQPAISSAQIRDHHPAYSAELARARSRFAPDRVCRVLRLFLSLSPTERTSEPNWGDREEEGSRDKTNGVDVYCGLLVPFLLLSPRCVTRFLLLVSAESPISITASHPEDFFEGR